MGDSDLDIVAMIEEVKRLLDDTQISKTDLLGRELTLAQRVMKLIDRANTLVKSRNEVRAQSCELKTACVDLCTLVAKLEERIRQLEGQV